MFLGDADVGKTCLAKLFVDRNVVDQTTNTIGFDHHVKEIELEGGIAVKVSKFIIHCKFDTIFTCAANQHLPHYIQIEHISVGLLRSPN